VRCPRHVIERPKITISWLRSAARPLSRQRQGCRLIEHPPLLRNHLVSGRGSLLVSVSASARRRSAALCAGLFHARPSQLSTISSATAHQDFVSGSKKSSIPPRHR